MLENIPKILKLNLSNYACANFGVEHHWFYFKSITKDINIGILKLNTHIQPDCFNTHP